MPRVKLTPELKKAISNLPDKEKDKLIFRLLPSKEVLVETLEYKLLEKEETTEDRREDVRNEIKRMLDKYPARYNTPWILVKEIRTYSAKITRHVSVTKDKLGEVDLHFYLLLGIIEANHKRLLIENHYVMEKLSKYTVLRAKKINTLLSKLHEDYVLEFENDLKRLGNYLNEIKSMKLEAAKHAVNVSTLMKGEIY